MARFLKQSFAQTCLKETDNGNCINLIIEMSPRFVLGRENVPCVAEVVNRSLKADCADFIITCKILQESSVARFPANKFARAHADY